MAVQPQSVPVRIYDGDEHIVLAAPLPGVEAENISVTIAGSKVTIIGEERGPRQHERHVLVDEWSIGPYRREVSIPQAINGSLTNATYGNGGGACGSIRRNATYWSCRCRSVKKERRRRTPVFSSVPLRQPAASASVTPAVTFGRPQRRKLENMAPRKVRDIA